MGKSDKNRIFLWIWQAALCSALVVGVLSWINGSGLTQCILRSGLTFFVVYSVSAWFVHLFRTSAGRSDIEARGALLDVAVGLDDDPGHGGLGNRQPFPGQIETDLGSGKMDRERQAQILQRMGWGNEGS